LPGFTSSQLSPMLSRPRRQIRTRISSLRCFVLFGLAILGFSATNAWAEERLIERSTSHGFPINVQRLTIQQGLSQNTVLDVKQDSQGFVWLATENGLNRYDGYHVKSYLRGINRGLPDDFVYSIAEDHNADLWVGTARGGLARWDREFDQFEAVPLEIHDRPVQRIRKLLFTSKNHLWIGTRDRGLLVRSLTDGSVRHFEHDPDRSNSLPSNRINTLFQDRGGLIWVGTDKGIVRFDPASDSFLPLGRQAALSEIADYRVKAVFEDHQGVLWFGTESKGLIAYHRSNRQLSVYPATGQPGAFCGGSVTAIVEDLSHRLWSATDRGLCVFDRIQGGFDHYGASDNAIGLGDNDLLSLLLDHSGQLWVGTRNNGINQWNPQSWQLGHTLAEMQLGSVSSFATDRDGYWVGSTSNGLFRVQHDGEIRRFSEADGLQDHRVMSLATSADHGLWVGTMKGGLAKLTPQGEVQQTWRAAKPPATTGLPADGVMSLLEDSRGRLWVGTFGGGVARLDPASRKFSHFLHSDENPTGLLGNQGFVVAEDLTGTIWVGTELGLNRFDEQSGSFESFTHETQNPSSLTAESVYALHVDPSGTLWAGTAGGGLNKVIVGEQVRFEQQQQLTALGMNLIYGIRSDHSGHLWLSGNRGLVRYNPMTGEGKRFRKAHGLQGDEFNFGAHHAGVDGHLYFGGTNGFNRFDPTKLSRPIEPPRVAVTRIQLGSEDLKERFAPDVKKLSLTHLDDVMTFEFAALDFVDAASNRFEYRLKGHDNRWIDAGTSHRISYSNVPAGNYLFEVRGASSTGLWSDSPASLAIDIAPPPWRSLPAYVCYLLLLVGLIWLAVSIWSGRRAKERAHRKELHRLAYFDGLTQLPNRHQLLETGEVLIAEKPANQLLVMHINLDHFKRLNDSFGRATADRLLVKFSEVLQTQVALLGTDSNQVLFARIGGDEFALVVSGLASGSEKKLLLARLQSALSRTLQVDLAEALMTVSIGASTYPQDATLKEGVCNTGSSMEELLRRAEIAMRHAKTAGRNDFCEFEPAMVSDSEADLQLETELHAAIEANELELYYQPKTDLETGRVCGAEALLRWNHPVRGMVSPGVFIPMAERSGLISQIDRWVLKRAFEQQERWQENGFQDIALSLNVSAGQFARTEFLDYLRHLIGRHQIDNHSIEIEITEGVLMQDARAARKTLKQIKELGFRVAIDDFGTGYSSLSYLKNFAVDVLKIDQSFVAELETDESNRSICRAVLGLAHSLGLDAVAEGVETEAQYQFLRDEGCDQVQGYWVARPQPVAAFEDFVRHRNKADIQDHQSDSSTPVKPVLVSRL